METVSIEIEETIRPKSKSIGEETNAKEKTISIPNFSTFSDPNLRQAQQSQGECGEEGWYIHRINKEPPISGKNKTGSRK
jgi:hypothetical protein